MQPFHHHSNSYSFGAMSLPGTLSTTRLPRTESEAVPLDSTETAWIKESINAFNAFVATQSKPTDYPRSRPVAGLTPSLPRERSECVDAIMAAEAIAGDEP